MFVRSTLKTLLLDPEDPASGSGRPLDTPLSFNAGADTVRFMVTALPVRAEMGSVLGVITHMDHASRVQTDHVTDRCSP